MPNGFSGNVRSSVSSGTSTISLPLSSSTFFTLIYSLDASDLSIIQPNPVIITNLALIGGHAVCLARLIIGFMLDSAIDSRNGSLRTFLELGELVFQILSLPIFLIFDLLSLKGWRFVDQLKEVWGLFSVFLSSFAKFCRNYN